jgi:hypothetical protein
MKIAAILFVALTANTAWAQPDEPKISVRPFVMAAGEQFNAQLTFDAAFGRSTQPLFGGGVQVALRMGLFAEVSASRFKKTGQRAFVDGSQVFRLGIPLTATFTTVEVTGGYRFHPSQHPRLLPYVAAGVGSYQYKESSGFATAGENVDMRHVGYVANGGIEVRLHRWVGLASDVQFSHVPGILGAAGVSKDAKEDDLGGVAVRVKLVIGR